MNSVGFRAITTAVLGVFITGLAAAQPPPSPYPWFQANSNWAIVGRTGISFMDVNADGLVDAIGKPTDPNSKLIIIWCNKGVASGDLFDGFAALGSKTTDYGVSLGDFDNDGFPDLVNEPRGSAFSLLRNRGLPGCDPNSDPFEEHGCVFSHCAGGRPAHARQETRRKRHAGAT